MSEDILLRYAQSSFAPAERVRMFLHNDPRLVWASRLALYEPQADVQLGGSTLRSILLGHVPETLVVTVAGLAPNRLRAFLSHYGNLACEAGDSVITLTPHSSDSPVVVSDSPPERADFTIDSLRYRTRRHTLADPTGFGLSDLSARRLRTVHYPLRQFAEQPLCTLRALHAAAAHRLSFSEETWHALTRSLPRLNGIQRDNDGSAGYRYPRSLLGAALLRIVTSEPRYGAALVHASGLLSLLCADAAHDAGWERSLQAIDVLTRDDVLRSHGLTNLDAATLLSALLAFQPVAPSLAAHLVRTYHLHQFPADHSAAVDPDTVTWQLSNLRMFDDVDPASMAPSAFERFFTTARGRALLALMHAVFLVEDRHHVARERTHVARRLLERYDEQSQRMPKLLRGRDLDTLGVPPGPLYRRLLATIRDAQLSGTIATKDEALQLVRMELTRL